MILAHLDSSGNAWYFRFNADRKTVGRIARKLFDRAIRVQRARNNDELARARLAEAVALADLQAYNTATEAEFAAATPDERYII